MSGKKEAKGWSKGNAVKMVNRRARTGGSLHKGSRGLLDAFYPARSTEGEIMILLTIGDQGGAWKKHLREHGLD